MIFAARRIVNELHCLRLWSAAIHRRFFVWIAMVAMRRDKSGDKSPRSKKRKTRQDCSWRAFFDFR
jgi:hypothetical protein